MTVSDMVRITNAKILLGEDQQDLQINSAFCSDLMSDVLAFVTEDTVLITGLMNPHVIRTSEMLDLRCILFVRGKTPSQEILDAAEELGIVVLSTGHSAFTSCGLLYEAGMRGIMIRGQGGQ